jgi:Mannosylglycerate hydrolase MGH1-like glycoside hydrolase domain
VNISWRSGISIAAVETIHSVSTEITMKLFLRALLFVGPITILGAAAFDLGLAPVASGQIPAQGAATKSSRAAQPGPAATESAEYQQTQARLAQGWNTWDVHSVATQVLLPEGLAIHVSLNHNSTEWHEGFLSDALIGRQGQEVERVVPGPHAWDGSYTELRLSWRGHNVRLQSAHEGKDLVLLATPLPPPSESTAPISALSPTIIISVNYLWSRPGTVVREKEHMEARGAVGTMEIYCTCGEEGHEVVDLPIAGQYFALDFTTPVGVSTGKSRTLAEIQDALGRQKRAYDQSIAAAGNAAPIADAIQTTLGWDTIYEPEGQRVISPVSRVWSVGWGGYVIFDWDNFFAATMASIGDRDLAYANAIETLRESTAQGFVPNYARARGWKSSDRSEPPVGGITVLGLYQKFGDRWLLRDTFEPLLRWNRWWSEHREIQGYLTWGSDGENQPANFDDDSRGTRGGAILESGLDNSPMYDDATYNNKTHQLEWADVGLMSLYIADCDALATMADVLGGETEAKELHERSARYRAKLATLWDEKSGSFLNKDLHTGQFSSRLSPTNFYPLLAKAATPAQADLMIKKHLLNTQEFWGEWVIPAIARNDAAFKDQEYWRGRIWGPMNYLVYLGLRNYDVPEVRAEFAQKSYKLFLKEWVGNGHVHENYNAMTGTGDDVTSSDRFYHWGALLGFVEYLQQSAAVPGAGSTH